MTALVRECSVLCALLAAASATDEEELAALLEAHTAACPACAATEFLFDDAMVTYRATADDPLPAAITDRLLREGCAGRGEPRRAPAPDASGCHEP